MMKYTTYKDCTCICGEKIPANSSAFIISGVVVCGLVCASAYLNTHRPHEMESSRWYICHHCKNTMPGGSNVFIYKGYPYCSIECAETTNSYPKTHYQCYNCHNPILRGETEFRYHGNSYCSRQCIDATKEN